MINVDNTSSSTRASCLAGNASPFLFHQISFSFTKYEFLMLDPHLPERPPLLLEVPPGQHQLHCPLQQAAPRRAVSLRQLTLLWPRQLLIPLLEADPRLLSLGPWALD